jgi:hypothetical protein
MFANNKEKENFTSKPDYSDYILVFPRLGSYESLCDFRAMERLRGKYERDRDWSLIVELVGGGVRNSVRLLVASSTSGSKRPRIAAPRK